MRVERWCAGLLAAVVAVGPGACGSSDEPPPEETLLGDGVHGPQRVPAGGTMAAEHEGAATVQSNATGAAIVVDTEPGKTTTVRGLKIDCRGGVGIVVRGGGAFRAERLDLKCSRGIGVAAEGQSSVVLASVQIAGSIRAEDVPNLSFPLSWDQGPIVGVVLSKVASAQLSNVSVSGFGGFGAVSVGSTLTWDAGTLTGNVGVGFMQQGGTVSLSSLRIDQTRAGQRGTTLDAYGAVVTGQGTLRTSSLTVEKGDGYGIVQSEATSTHSSLAVRNNSDVGLWVQRSRIAGAVALKLEGTGNVFESNQGGGIFVMDSDGVDLQGVRSALAVVKKIATSETGMDDMADGVQIANVGGQVTLKDLVLDSNPRAGLVLSGAMSLSATNVSILGEGQHGLVSQSGASKPDAAAVTYGSPTLKATDDAFQGTVPPAVPKKEMVSVSVISDQGLIGDQGVVNANGDVGAQGVVCLGGLKGTQCGK
jgi:hypothetical protein